MLSFVDMVGLTSTRKSPYIPADHVVEPREICIVHNGKFLCCTTHTPSTGLSCKRWLWWYWHPRTQCCASVEAELQLQFLQSPSVPRRSRGAQLPCWPCLTCSDRWSNCKVQKQLMSIYNIGDNIICLFHIKPLTFNRSTDKTDRTSWHVQKNHLKSKTSSSRLKRQLDFPCYSRCPNQYQLNSTELIAGMRHSSGVSSWKSCEKLSGIRLWWVAGDCICN